MFGASSALVPDGQCSAVRHGSLIRFSFRIGHPAYLVLRISLVIGCRLASKDLALRSSLPRSFDTLDATQALAALGQNFAHFFDRVMNAALVAQSCFRHRYFGFPISVIEMAFYGEPTNSASGACVAIERGATMVLLIAKVGATSSSARSIFLHLHPQRTQVRHRIRLL